MFDPDVRWPGTLVNAIVVEKEDPMSFLLR